MLQILADELGIDLGPDDDAGSWDGPAPAAPTPPLVTLADVTCTSLALI